MRNHIGKAIREKRLEFHMTQDELAKRLNVTRDAVGKWENQINSVHSDYLPEIANILGTSIDELFAYEGGKAKIRQDIQCEESMIDAAEDNDTEKILVVSNDFVHEAPEEFKDRIKYGYFSLSDEDYESCEMNPCAIPEGVSPQRWAEILIEEICSAYKIKKKDKGLLTDVVFALYEKEGIFSFYAERDEDTGERLYPMNVVLNDNDIVTMFKIYEEVSKIRSSMVHTHGPNKTVADDLVKKCTRIMDALFIYSKDYSTEFNLLSSGDIPMEVEVNGEQDFVCLDGFQINELLSHKITYMNSNGLNKRSVKFIVGLARAWCDETGRSIIVMTKEEYAEYSSRA